MAFAGVITIMSCNNLDVPQYYDIVTAPLYSGSKQIKMFKYAKSGKMKMVLVRLPNFLPHS